MSSPAFLKAPAIKPTLQQAIAEDDLHTMQIEISSGEEEEDDSSQDELSTLQPKQATPKRSNKKRTLEQRSPQKKPQETVVQDGVVPSQKARWTYCISQGVKAFREALKLAEGQDYAAEAATRELLQQAQAVQEGRVESALAATRELAKEIQALKQYVLEATSPSIQQNTAYPAKAAKKTYAEAMKPSITTDPNNTPLLAKSKQAVVS